MSISKSKKGRNCSQISNSKGKQKRSAAGWKGYGTGYGTNKDQNSETAFSELSELSESAHLPHDSGAARAPHCCCSLAQEYSTFDVMFCLIISSDSNSVSNHRYLYLIFEVEGF
jgi:hypothetical protein